MLPLNISNRFPNIFDRFLENDISDWSNKNFTDFNTTLPSVNIKVLDNSYEIELAAPGLEKSDFKIETNNNILTISSEKTIENKTEEDEHFSRKEFSYQSFTRSFTLPDMINDKKITAKYKDGILKVSLPKKEESKTKKVKQIRIS